MDDLSASQEVSQPGDPLFKRIRSRHFRSLKALFAYSAIIAGKVRPVKGGEKEDRGEQTAAAGKLYTKILYRRSVIVVELLLQQRMNAVALLEERSSVGQPSPANSLAHLPPPAHPSLSLAAPYTRVCSPPPSSHLFHSCTAASLPCPLPMSSVSSLLQTFAFNSQQEGAMEKVEGEENGRRCLTCEEGSLRPCPRKVAADEQVCATR
eukprot:768705-Hanusia_phi.AAC.3